MIIAPLYTVSHFLCPLPSISYHLSLFLICFLLPFSSHLSCLHLSFCRLLSNHFFCLFTFFSLISALFILYSVCCILSFFTSPILPPFLPRSYPSVLPLYLLLHVKFLSLSFILSPLSLCVFYLPTYLSFFLSFSVCSLLLCQ